MLSEKEIEYQTKALLEKNTVSGTHDHGKQTYHYMKPSAHRYPYQYFWDTCFHSIIMVAMDMSDKAKKCIRSLFTLQDEDGFVGHMLFWKRYLPNRLTDFYQTRFKWKHFFRPHMSSLLQPPLAAFAVYDIFMADGDEKFLKEMLPKLKKYYKWIAEKRDFDQTGLISLISYFESGMDWKPSYDEVLGLKPEDADGLLFKKVTGNDFRNFKCGYNLRKIYQRDEFIVKDAGYNTMYIENLRYLTKLCDMQHDPEKYYFSDKADQAAQSLQRLMYNAEDQAYYDIFGREHRQLKTLTPTIFFPLTLEEVTTERARQVFDRHLLNTTEFAVRYPIPSLAINHPAFNPQESKYIWRGPTWIVYSWFLHRSLKNKGYHREAGLLVDTTRRLIEKSGFREYYNPFNGEGYGAHDFTWSGLIIDMIGHDKD